jgi:hypothetical protein
MDVMRDEFVGTYGEIFTGGGVAQDIITTMRLPISEFIIMVLPPLMQLVPRAFR